MCSEGAGQKKTDLFAIYGKGFVVYRVVYRVYRVLQTQPCLQDLLESNNDLYFLQVYLFIVREPIDCATLPPCMTTAGWWGLLGWLQELWSNTPSPTRGNKVQDGQGRDVGGWNGVCGQI